MFDKDDSIRQLRKKERLVGATEKEVGEKKGMEEVSREVEKWRIRNKKVSIVRRKGNVGIISSRCAVGKPPQLANLSEEEEEEEDLRCASEGRQVSR